MAAKGRCPNLWQPIHPPAPAETATGVDTGISIGTDERKAFDYLFNKADSEQLGVLTGDKAVEFFDAAQLPPQVRAMDSGDMALVSAMRGPRPAWNGRRGWDGPIWHGIADQAY